ncbi:MAG: MHS family MFS transporter [Acidobacteria bacterium]|nr:MHS family MFS transporter [Acidobacteriota bacterium]
MRTASTRERNRALVAGTIGAALEWYDFTLYGIASAIVLGPVFFPSENPVFSLLSSFASFGVGFFARPFGGIIFGNLGDKIGRRLTLVLTLTLMSVSTFGIGCLPSFARGGIWAPALLVLFRIMQGLGSGSDIAGATLLASEYAPNHRRGLMAAIPLTGNPLGAILASAVFGLCTMLPRNEFMTWGWRIPFLLSAFLFVIGLYVRLGIQESPVFEKAKQQRHTETRTGFLALLRCCPDTFFKALMLNVGPNVTSYLPTAYGLAYMTQTLHLSPTVGTNTLAICNVCILVVQPLAGHIADKVGRRKVFISGALLAAALAFPFFSLLKTGKPSMILLGFILLFVLAGSAVLGSQASLLPEQFPTEVRYSGVAVSREFASALVGGTLPFIATAVVTATGSSWAVSLLCVALMLIAAVGAFLCKEGKGKSLFPNVSSVTNRVSV